MNTKNKKHHIADEAIDAIVHLLSANENIRGYNLPEKSRMMFDGFEVFDTGDDSDEIIIGEGGDPPIWPVNAKWAFQVKDENDILGWSFARVCTLDMKKWRGRIEKTARNMYELHQMEVTKNSNSVYTCIPIIAVKNYIIDVATVKSDQSLYGTIPNWMHPVNICHGVMLRREYLWSVLFGEPGIPRARFSTDLIGVREAFRLRDIPPGKDRRAALRHWVREHWRKNRSDKDTASWVKQHLRGALDFSWNGLSCRIQPPMELVRKELMK